MIKKYFVVSDIHGFFSILKQTLEKGGFEIGNENHVLIVIGDIFDRGSECVELLDFLTDLKSRNQLVFCRGNHEDLLFQCYYEMKLHNFEYSYNHHYFNGTVDTVLSLKNADKIDEAFDLISKSVNYYETKNYIFTHGYIPTDIDDNGYPIYMENWRDASDFDFRNSRWVNGMGIYSFNITEKGKTICIGHWNAGWGNAILHHEEGDQWLLSDHPFVDDGIIALDAATASTGVINLIVLEDEELA